MSLGEGQNAAVVVGSDAMEARKKIKMENRSSTCPKNSQQLDVLVGEEAPTRTEGNWKTHVLVWFEVPRRWSRKQNLGQS